MNTVRLLRVAFLVLCTGAAAWAADEGAEPGKIDGYVRSKRGKPIPRARVAIVKENDPRAPRAFTDQQGHFRLDNVPAGTYVFEVSAAGFKTQRREGVTVQAGKLLKLTFGLEAEGAPAQIVVIVTAPDGKPADQGKCLIKEGPSRQGEVVRIKSGGVLHIQGLQAGKYVLMLTKPGVGGLEVKDLHLEPGQKYTGQFKLDAKLAPPMTGTVKITVRTSNQQPVAKARVVLWKMDSKKNRRFQQTNEQGVAVLEGVPQAKYGVMAVKNGFRRFFKKDVSVTAGEQTVLEVTLMPRPQRGGR